MSSWAEQAEALARPPRRYTLLMRKAEEDGQAGLEVMVTDGRSECCPWFFIPGPEIRPHLAAALEWIDRAEKDPAEGRGKTT